MWYSLPEKKFQEDWAMLGAEMITLKDNDQVAPIMPVFTWTENFLIDVVSQHPNKGVHKEQSGYLEFRANLGSLDPKGEFEM